MRHSLRNPTNGRYVPNSSMQSSSVPQTSSTNVVPGRLYGYQGFVVRAGRKTNNGLRVVSYHKKVNGFVKDSELRVIDNNKVNEYLGEVNVTRT